MLEESQERKFENADTDGKAFVRYMQELIWTLDPQMKTLKESVGFELPLLFQQVYSARTGRQLGDILPYNNYTAKKQPKPRLSQDILNSLISTGYEYVIFIFNSCFTCHII